MLPDLVWKLLPDQEAFPGILLEFPDPSRPSTSYRGFTSMPPCATTAVHSTARHLDTHVDGWGYVFSHLQHSEYVPKQHKGTSLPLTYVH